MDSDLPSGAAPHRRQSWGFSSPPPSFFTPRRHYASGTRSEHNTPNFASGHEPFTRAGANTSSGSASAHSQSHTHRQGASATPQSDPSSSAGVDDSGLAQSPVSRKTIVAGLRSLRASLVFFALAAALAMYITTPYATRLPSSNGAVVDPPCPALEALLHADATGSSLGSRPAARATDCEGCGAERTSSFVLNSTALPLPQQVQPLFGQPLRFTVSSFTTKDTNNNSSDEWSQSYNTGVDTQPASATTGVSRFPARPTAAALHLLSSAPLRWLVSALCVQALLAWLILRAAAAGPSLLSSALAAITYRSARAKTMTATVGAFLARVRVDANLPLLFAPSAALAELTVPAAAALAVTAAAALAETAFALAQQAVVLLFATVAVTAAAAPAVGFATRMVFAGVNTSNSSAATVSAGSADPHAVLAGLTLSVFATITLAVLLAAAFPARFNLLREQTTQNDREHTITKSDCGRRFWTAFAPAAGAIAQATGSLSLCAAAAVAALAPTKAALAATAAGQVGPGAAVLSLADVVTVGVAATLATCFYSLTTHSHQAYSAHRRNGSASMGCDTDADTESGSASAHDRSKSASNEGDNDNGSNSQSRSYEHSHSHSYSYSYSSEQRAQSRYFNQYAGARAAAAAAAYYAAAASAARGYQAGAPA